MKVKNKKSILFLFGLSLIFIVIGVIAYFSNSEIMQNRFISGTYKTVTRETFTSPTNWIPGQETEKSIVTKNEGTIPVRVRVKLDESWTSKNNDPLDLEYNGEKAAIINFDNESDWLKKGDYYYYLEELAPGDETSSLIKSVTFNSNVEPDILCTTSNNVYTCESTGDGYDGATYELDITIETVQANKYREVWGSNSPIMYDYVGDNPCTFNGELVPGVEYVNGQYTYVYMKEWGWDNSIGTYGAYGWVDITDSGWGVKLTNPDSTDPIHTTLCSSVNDKPVVSMANTFCNSQATDLDLSIFDTSNVTNMSWMFGKVQVTSLNLSNFNTSNVTNMSGMFWDVPTQLDLSSFNTSNVTDMSEMFEGTQATVLDLRNFDTSNVTNMNMMFSENKSTSIDLSSFDTSQVTDMSEMFWGSQISSLDLSNFNTSNVTDMNFMFYNSNATSINLSSFDTRKVTDMSHMFSESKVTTIDLSNFDMSGVSDVGYMFYNAVATTGYGKTQADCDKLNSSSNKPSELVFVVKES